MNNGRALVTTTLVENEVIYHSEPVLVEQAVKLDRIANCDINYCITDSNDYTLSKISIEPISKFVDGPMKSYIKLPFDPIQTKVSDATINLDSKGIVVGAKEQTFTSLTPYSNINVFVNPSISVFNIPDIKLNASTVNVKAKVKATFDDIQLPAISAQSQIFKNQYKLNSINTVVEDKTNKAATSQSMTIPALMVNVEDYKAPTWNATGTTGNIKDFKFVIQKNTFVEINMNFADSKLVDCAGLPEGMFIEKTYLKGVPTLSGKYAINIKLDNGSVLSGLIIVPNVQRVK